MIGRTPSHIQAIRPLKDGVIADFEICEKMLRYFIQRVHQRRFAKPRMVICVPSGITGVEQRAVMEAAEYAGARKAYIIEEPMAAAIGAGLPVHEPTGNMVVDIGGGTTEVAVISLGGIVTSQSVRIGGDELDEAIISFIKKEYSLALGERTAEEIKIALGSAFPLEEELHAEIRGRDLVTGLPEDRRGVDRGDPQGHRRAGVGHHRRRQGDARQDPARAGRRHHGAGDRAHRWRRAAARPRRPAAGGDRHAHRGRPRPPELRGHRQRPVPRGVRGPQAGPHHVLRRVMGVRARRGPRSAIADHGRRVPRGLPAEPAPRLRAVRVAEEDTACATGSAGLTIGLLVLASITIITLDYRGDAHGVISGAKRGAHDAFAPVQRGVDARRPTRSAASWPAPCTAATSQDQNAKLRREVGALQRADAGRRRPTRNAVARPANASTSCRGSGASRRSPPRSSR